jgi:hypothetical protein
MSNDMPDRDMNLLLASLRDTDRGVTQDCFDEVVWFEVAGGCVPDEVATVLLPHASVCPRCSRLLAQAIEDFSDERAVEPAFVTGKHLSRAVKRGIRQSRLSWVAATGFWRAATVVLLFAVGSGAWHFWWPYFAEQRAASLLAQAEAGTRFSAFRFSGQPYAPTRLARSVSPNVPACALKAQQWTRWASGDARATTLRFRTMIAANEPHENPEQLEQVINRTVPTRELMNDLAAVWAASAERDRDPSKAVTALEIVDRALALSPAFPEALFNRALILNLLNRHGQACDTLVALRAAEKDSRWSKDLSARLLCNR